jgi:hypothetical protein
MSEAVLGWAIILGATALFVGVSVLMTRHHARRRRRRRAMWSATGTEGAVAIGDAGHGCGGGCGGGS